MRRKWPIIIEEEEREWHQTNNNYHLLPLIPRSFHTLPSVLGPIQNSTTKTPSTSWDIISESSHRTSIAQLYPLRGSDGGLNACGVASSLCLMDVRKRFSNLYIVNDAVVISSIEMNFTSSSLSLYSNNIGSN